MKLTSLLIFAPFAPLVWALPSVALATDQPDCEKIQQACGEAGYTRGVPDGKDLMSKCFDPIMKGQNIEGVKVDPDSVKKCTDEQKQPKSKGKHKHGGG
jgi:hypothetical protein